MPYSAELVNTALAQLRARRHRDEAALIERRTRLYEHLPDLQRLDAQLVTTVSRLLTLPRDETEQEWALAELRAENLRLQAERAALLEDNGYDADVLDLPIYCTNCNDSGYADGATCGCVEALCAAEQRKRLSHMLDLRGQTFDSFDLSYYSTQVDQAMGDSPRALAEISLRYCRRYAAEFSLDSPSLLLLGKPGLGKTFLSAAIAGVVAGNGFSVVYDSIGAIITTMEAEKFERRDGTQGSERYLNCDLLILDDLGTEMATPFAQSALYTLVNQRLTSSRPTIISTNLTMDELGKRYNPALLSRLRGVYETLFFLGEDIRQQKRRFTQP